MRPPRRVLAVLEEALAVREDARSGVALRFRAAARRGPELPILAYLDLREGDEIAAALGRAKLLRLLREARLAGGDDFAGRPEAAARRLSRALGRTFWLEVVQRARVRFEAWTDDGRLAVDDVSDVVADEGAFLVRRLGPYPPVRIERDGVSRRETRLERWLEVRTVARKPA